jgi:DNA-binding response OmpR family regulator
MHDSRSVRTISSGCAISAAILRGPTSRVMKEVPQVSARILVVEDQPDVAQLIEVVLKGEGHTVAIAPDGAQGLMLSRDWDPDLILMDIMLPGVDGGTLISRLREDKETADVPIIAMSASRTLRDRSEELQADALLSKPFDVDALLVQVQFLLSRGRGDGES